MKRLQVAAKLAGVIDSHKVTALGPLWADSFASFPSSSGFYRLETSSAAPESVSTAVDHTLQNPRLLPVVSFLDKTLFPSINIFHDASNEDISASEWTDTQLKLSVEKRSEVIKSLPSDGAFRLVNGRRDRLPGLTIDVYGNHAIIGISSAYWKQDLERLQKYIRSAVPSTHSIRYCDHSAKEGRKPSLVYSCTYMTGKTNPANIVVQQNECKFTVSLRNGLSTGLFLDQSVNREIVASLAPPGSSMLNLFSYTCSFSVVASKLGQFKTTNIDIAPKSLDVAKANFGLNNLSLSDHNFITAESFDFLRQKNADSAFDVVVCDPPTVFNAKLDGNWHQVVSCKKHLDHIVHAAARAVKPGGHLVMFCNSHSLRKSKWLAMVEAGLARHAERNFELGKFLGASPDFFDDAVEPDLKGVIIKRLA